MRFVASFLVLFALICHQLGAAMTISNLSSSGRCTAASFGHNDPPPAVPGAGKNLKITNLATQKGTGQVTLTFTGITAESPEDLTNVQNKDGFYHVYRCDQNSTDATVWVTVTPTDGTAKTTVTNEAGQSTLTVTDSFTGVSAVDSEYYYIVVAMFGQADVSINGTEIVINETAHDNALRLFNAASSTPGAGQWSLALGARVTFIPEQEHVVYNATTSSNFVNSNGLITPIADPVVSLAVGQATTQTFTTTAHAANFSGALSYSWTGSMTYNGGSASVTGMTLTTTTNDSVTLAGTPASNANPGDYILTLQNTTTGATSGNSTTSDNITVRLNPATLNISDTSGSVGAVEIGPSNGRAVTMGVTGGFSEGAGVNFVDYSWSIANANSNLTFASNTATGKTPSFTISLPEDAALVGNPLTFELTVTETCQQSAPSFCASMAGTRTETVSITALGHNLDFSNRSTETAQGDFTNVTTYIPVYYNSNQTSITDFTSYTIQATNMLDVSGTQSNIATMTLVSFLTGSSAAKPATTNAIASNVASANGIRVTVDNSTASATVTRTSATNLGFNDTFLVTIRAESYDKNNAATQAEITLGFIGLEAQAPSITTSQVLENSTAGAFTWPAGFTSLDAFPVRTDAQVRVVFDENVSTPSVQFGMNATATAMDGNAPGTTFTKVFASADLQSKLGSGTSTWVHVMFSGSQDQNNNHNKNTMKDLGPKSVNLVQTPTVSGNPSGTFDRDDAVEISVSEAIDEVDLTKVASSGVNIGDVFPNPDASSVIIIPAENEDLATGAGPHTVTFNPGSLVNSGGYPNITGDAVTITFAADTQAPIIVDVDLESNAARSAVTVDLLFNEALSQDPTVRVTNLLNGQNFTIPVTRSGKELTFATATLPLDAEIQILLEGVTDGTNSANYELEPFVTFGAAFATELAAEEAAVAAAKANDTDAPEVFEISPDFRIAENQVHQPRRPTIVLDFSEQMAASTTGSIWLTTAGSGVFNGIQLTATKNFDGYVFVGKPSAALSTGTTYWLNINHAQAVDANGGNQLDAGSRSFKFKTLGDGDVNVGPSFLGHNLSSKVEQGFQLYLTFSEPILASTLASNSSVKTDQGVTVPGKWVIEGTEATYVTTGITAGGSYVFWLSTAGIKDALGKTSPDSEIVNQAFTVEGATELREFHVEVADATGSNLTVEFFWLPPVNRTGIDTYRLQVEKYDASLGLAGSPSTLMDITSVNSASFTTMATIANFSDGDSYIFILSALNSGTAVDTDEVHAFTIPATALGAARVSVAANSASQVGSATGAAGVTIKPGDLKKSADIRVGALSGTAATNLKNQAGGGEKLSDVAVFAPDGLTFKKPVEISLKFNAPNSGTWADQSATNCAVATSAACASWLRDNLAPLFFDGASKTWNARGLTKGRVVVTSNTEALYKAKTSHFTSFVVAKSLVISSTAGALATGVLGESYTAFVNLSGAASANDVSINFNPSTFSLTGALDTTNSSRVKIESSNLEFTGTGTQPESVTVTVTVTDPANSQSQTKVFTISIPDSKGDETFTGSPNPVLSFDVQLTGTGTGADLVWTASDDAKTINTFVLKYVNLDQTNAQTTTTEYRRTARGASITGLTAGQTYQWTLYTVSAQGNRSTTEQEFFTDGIVLTNLVSGANITDAGGTNITLTLSGGAVVQAAAISAAYLNSQTGAGKLFLTTDTISHPNGAVKFNRATLVSLSFKAAGSVSFPVTAGTTGSVVYHYDAGRAAGYRWHALSTTEDPTTGLKATVDNATKTVTITASKPSGSPFVVGPAVAAPARSGGGGCSASGEADFGSGLINFLLILLPLAVFGLRLKK